MASVSVMHEQQMAATTSATGSAAGLRRSPSLLSPSIGAQQQCSHQVPQCIAQAHQVKNNKNERFIFFDKTNVRFIAQVEMEFANLSSRSFQLTVAAPNGEQSEIFEFNTYGQTATFCPRKPGCGHGTWKLKLRASDNSRSVF